MDFKEGEILAFFKPYTWTSFHLVNKVRYHLSKRFKVKRFKVGHAGTLDPLATGVLILCTGKATKRIEELQHHTKEYEADLMLGATTASYDKEHPVNATYPYEHITEEMFNEVLKKFTGTIAQRPPLYSACKVDGERAYNLARQGSDMQLAPKQITIEKIELLSFAPPQATIRVVCGKGTYIRSLARDLGEALGSGAHLDSLQRSRSGIFHVGNALTVEQAIEMLK